MEEKTTKRPGPDIRPMRDPPSTTPEIPPSKTPPFKAPPQVVPPHTSGE